MNWDEIYFAMAQRRTSDSILFRSMIETRDRYDGDVVVPLPDVDGETSMSPPSARLIADAIDSTAMRAASVMPITSTPALDPVKERGTRSREFAAIRRRACYASWHNSALDVLLLRYYRHLVGYGTADMIVLPDFDAKRARIELRDPLTAYPELRSPDDVREPINIGFVFGRSRAWMLKNYPETKPMLDGLRYSEDVLWDVLEWVDCDDIVIGVLGPRIGSTGSSAVGWGTTSNIAGVSSIYARGMELRRWPNRAGMVPVATPRRVTLDRVFGQVSHLIGAVDLLDRMTALEVIAAERNVFPDMVVVGQGGRMPTLVGGTWRDGRTGEANIIIDGAANYLNTTPGPATPQVLAMLERNIRMSSGNPSMFSGENTGSLRSGQTVNSLAGFSVDPRIQEAHTLAQRSLAVINTAIMATEKGYWPNKSYSVYSGLVGDDHVDYMPSKHFETFDNVVQYPFPGMDLSQVTVAVSQLNASGLVSKSTARVQHPFVADADVEAKRVLLERVDEAALMALLQQLQTGTITWPDYIIWRDELNRTGDLGLAAEAAQKAAQLRQATAAPPPAEGQVAAPETQPGLNQAGMGAEQPPPGPGGIPGANTDQVKLDQMLRALRSRPSPPPRTAAPV